MEKHGGVSLVIFFSLPVVPGNYRTQFCKILFHYEIQQNSCALEKNVTGPPLA